MDLRCPALKSVSEKLGRSSGTWLVIAAFQR
jgi:hypothetical protein